MSAENKGFWREFSKHRTPSNKKRRSHWDHFLQKKIKNVLRSKNIVSEQRWARLCDPRVRSTMRELALGKGRPMTCSSTLNAAYHVLNVLHLLCVCIGLTKYRCRTAFKGFSATVATMKELALGEGWYMVCSSTWYLQSIMFKSDWMC